MTDQELIIVWLPFLALFVFHLFAIWYVGTEKGIDMSGLMLLAILVPPISWLYAIGMPISEKRAAEREIRIAGWVAEIERREASKQTPA